VLFNTQYAQCVLRLYKNTIVMNNYEPAISSDVRCLHTMVTSMPTTIHQALRPLSITCFIVGLSVCPFNGPRIGWSEYLSLLYCLTIWFVYEYILYYIMILFSRISLLLSDMLYIMLVNIPITIISMLMCIMTK